MGIPNGAAACMQLQAARAPCCRQAPPWHATSARAFQNPYGASQELHLTGIAVATDGLCLVVAEGGAKAQKKYAKLLLHRIDWAAGRDEDAEGAAAGGAPARRCPGLLPFCAIVLLLKPLECGICTASSPIYAATYCWRFAGWLKEMFLGARRARPGVRLRAGVGRRRTGALIPGVQLGGGAQRGGRA